MKKCSTCQETKPYEEYHKTNRTKDGYKCDCKKCRSLSAKQFRVKHREKMLEKEKEKRSKESYQNYHKEYYDKNAEKLKKYSKKSMKKLFDKNPEEFRKKKRDYARELCQKNLNHRLRGNLRHRMWGVLRGIHKSESSLQLLGCSIEEWKKHLESKFTEGMSWENYGKWHIDHIIPCTFFDLTIKENQFKCFHYSNTQPLWAEQNISKGSKLIQ